MYFSCSGKKSTKRIRLKGRYEQMRPLKKPPPHRRKVHPNTNTLPNHPRPQQVFRWGPGGGLGGGRLKVGVVVLETEAVTKDFAVSASPSRFLWFVSCAATRNEHITSFESRLFGNACLFSLSVLLLWQVIECAKMCATEVRYVF